MTDNPEQRDRRFDTHGATRTIRVSLFAMGLLAIGLAAIVFRSSKTYGLYEGAPVIAAGGIYFIIGAFRWRRK